jgi:membrane carboxypeptidase/penicillin-binding protein
VLAEVGNVKYKQLKYDVIATGWRQPGSTFKTFTYGGLVERLTNEVLAAKSPPETVEEISAEVLQRCTVLDAPIYVSLGRGRGAKKIENFHSRSEPEYRGDITCRIALGESRNTAAMRAGARAGIKNVIDLTYRLGMPRDAKHILQPYPTTAIGASEVNPLSMAQPPLSERWISSNRDSPTMSAAMVIASDRRRRSPGLRHQGRKHPPQERPFIPRSQRDD